MNYEEQTEQPQQVAGEVETEAKFRYQHFENSATRNHFELGFIDGANWREHHPATDWDGLKIRFGAWAIMKHKSKMNADTIVEWFKNELTK